MSDQIIIIDNTAGDSIFVNQNTAPENITIDTGGSSSVTSVNGRIGAIVLSKSDVGLNQVDNTSDLNKPISIDALSALLLKTDLSAFNVLNNLILNKYGSWDNVYATVNILSGDWNSIYSNVNSNSSTYATYNYVNNGFLPLSGGNSNNWNTAYNTLSTLTYKNVQANNVYETIQQYAASNPPNINKGSTVELTNGRVYIFAGTDVSNPAHYLEVNSNPISPVYAEALLYNNNQAIVDTFYVSDFKTAKYNLQIETNFNNEIYYSEINVVAAVGSAVATANEYGQVFTSELISSYDAEFDVNRVHLVINFSSEPTDLNHKLIVKGQRTNYYKI